MNKTNQELARSLFQFSDLMEASGENPYKIRAYRRAAESILQLKDEVETIFKEGKDLTSIPKIGKGIASVLIHLILTNKEPRLAERKNEARLPKPMPFIRLYHALITNDLILNHLKAIPEVLWVRSCGDFRRKKELITELNYLICVSDFSKVIKKVSEFREITTILDQSADRVSFFLNTGMKMELFLTSENSKGVDLIYKTGNINHIEALENLAKLQKLNLNEKGLFKNNKLIAGKNENSVYSHLGLEFIEPELREGRGEIEAAKNHSLPKLIELKELKGDLHSHTNETDGKESLESMVKTAIEHGYEYFAITDHSKRLAITNGLNEKRLLQQIEQIDELNASQNSILILKSIEVDILEDGSLDLSNEVLKKLDIRVCSIHSKFKLSEEKQTERIIKAMDNPYFNILGHPTGRLIKSRPPYPLNIEKIMLAAKERNCFLELNSQPYRLDINDSYCQMAKELGVKIAISSDAHSSRGLDFMKLGIYQARRGWLEKGDVLNTYSWPDLKKILQRN